MTPAGDDDEKYPYDEFGYTRTFDPRVNLISPSKETARAGGDRPQDSPYHYDEEIILAVNAALAANRPLLVAGPAGVGKSALAANIAVQMGWEYEPMVITGQTEGRDLLWRYDTVRRLRDAYLVAAHAGRAQPAVEDTPGAPDGARSDASAGEPAPEASLAGASEAAADEAAPEVAADAARAKQSDPGNVLPYIERGVLWRAFDRSRNGERVVVLIDEIDKADPDVPNSLLEVLGNGRFTFTETGETIEVNEEAPPFIVITTNDERELSRPFRRRCVTLTLQSPDAERLKKIAHSWNLDEDDNGDVLAPAIADEVAQLAGIETPQGKLEPNVAEYLDALRVCLDLEVEIPSDEWEAVKRFTLLKDLSRGGG